MHRWHLVEKEQLGKLLRIDPVVLPLGAENQPDVARVGHDDPPGNPDQLVVEVARSA